MRHFSLLLSTVLVFGFGANASIALADEVTPQTDAAVFTVDENAFSPVENPADTIGQKNKDISSFVDETTPKKQVLPDCASLVFSEALYIADQTNGNESANCQDGEDADTNHADFAPGLQPNVSVSMANPPAFSSSTHRISYTYTLTNSSYAFTDAARLQGLTYPNGATFVTSSGQIPCGNVLGSVHCVSVPLLGHQSKTVTVVMQLPATYCNVPEIAEATVVLPLESETNDQAAVTYASILYAPPCELTLTKTAEQPTVQLGDSDTFFLTVHNTSGHNANIEVKDTPGPGLAYDPILGGKSSCIFEEGKIFCSGFVPAGGSAVFGLPFLINGDVSCDSTLTNSANIEDWQDLGSDDFTAQGEISTTGFGVDILPKQATVTVQCETDTPPTPPPPTDTSGHEGAHRGHDTNIAYGEVNYLAKNLDLGLPPGGFGGTDNAPLSKGVLDYLCGIQSTGFSSLTTFMPFYVDRIAEVTGLDPAFISKFLLDPANCSNHNAALKPVTVAVASLKPFYVMRNKDGQLVPVTTSPFWDLCYATDGAIAQNAVDYKAAMALQTDRNRDGDPKPCSAYNTNLGGIGREHWTMPDGVTEFDVDRSTQTYYLEKGFELKTLDSVASR